MDEDGFDLDLATDFFKVQVGCLDDLKMFEIAPAYLQDLKADPQNPLQQTPFFFEKPPTTLPIWVQLLTTDPKFFESDEALTQFMSSNWRRRTVSGIGVILMLFGGGLAVVRNDLSVLGFGLQGFGMAWYLYAKRILRSDTKRAKKILDLWERSELRSRPQGEIAQDSSNQRRESPSVHKTP